MEPWEDGEEKPSHDTKEEISKRGGRAECRESRQEGRKIWRTSGRLSGMTGRAAWLGRLARMVRQS